MSNADELPDIEFQITCESVTAQPRNLEVQWSATSIADLREIWGWEPRRKITPLKRLVDVIDDPNYDPDNPQENEFEAPLSAEETLIGKMAAEMTAEIDNEILQTLEALNCPERALLGNLAAVEQSQVDVVLKVETARTAELTRRGIM